MSHILLFFLIRVMSFNGYLEVITVLEEHYNGFKDIHTHSLFSPIVSKKKSANATTCTYSTLAEFTISETQLVKLI